MILILQFLVLVSFGRRSRSYSPNFIYFGGEFLVDDWVEQKVPSDDFDKRRELEQKVPSDDFDKRRELGFWNEIENAVEYIGSGQAERDLEHGAEQTGAWAVSTGKDALETTTDGISVAAGEIGKKADEFKGTMENVATQGIQALQDIDFKDMMEQIDSVLRSMCIIPEGPDRCLTDIQAEGCMPGNENCVITYGHNCLNIEKDFGFSVESTLAASRNAGGVELAGGLTMYGGANAVISTKAAVELHINRDPKIRVIIEPPTIELDAEVRISAEGTVNAEAEEKRIDLGQAHEIKRKVFMAGFIPVMIVIRAQPVAFISASGELRGTGEIKYSARGSLTFTNSEDRDLYIELDLNNFHAMQNFDTIEEPEIQFDEGWEFELEANVDLQLTAKLGVELSVTLYDVVEVNMIPMVVAQVSANGRISVSGNGNIHGVGSLSAEASGLAEICLSGDFKGYMDWVHPQSKVRKSTGTTGKSTGRGRRELELQPEQRRELFAMEYWNFKDVMRDTCDMAVEAIAPGCEPAKMVLRGLCGNGIIQGLDLLGFPTQFPVPSFKQLALRGLDLPSTCWTMALELNGRMDFNNDNQADRIQCGGHFQGSTIGLESSVGNPSGDAWHTFVAGDEHMIIDACQSSYDSYIRLYHYERYSERHCLSLPFVGNVCMNWPRSRWSEVRTNDDHSGRCHNPNHGFASFLEVNNLQPGATYALVVEGYDDREGQYSVALSCPSLEASLRPQTDSGSAGCVDIEMHTRNWGYEVSWSISGGANCFGNGYGDNNEFEVKDCCLRPGQTFTLNCIDSYGDGWHGGFILINNKRYCDEFRRGSIETFNNMIV